MWNGENANAFFFGILRNQKQCHYTIVKMGKKRCKIAIQEIPKSEMTFALLVM